MPWTTRYLDAAVEQLRAPPAQQREHQVLGRYTFRAFGPVGSGLRALRDPAEV